MTFYAKKIIQVYFQSLNIFFLNLTSGAVMLYNKNKLRKKL